MAQNNFILDLIAGLQKTRSKQQIKADIKSLGDIYVKLIGNLNMTKTRQYIKNQLKGINNMTFKMTPIVNAKGVQTTVKQSINTAQKVANSNKIHYSFDMDKKELQDTIRIFAKENSKLFSSKEMTAKYNQLLNLTNVAKSKSELNALRKQLSAFRTELIATNKVGMTWTDKFKASISHFAQYFGGASFIYALTSQMHNAWTEAKTLDDRLVDLQKVTDEIESRDSLYKYFDRALNKANELNVKVDSLIYAITEFKKLGWALSDAELGAEWANIMSNVADVNIDTAIGSIKTAIASFDEIGGYGNDQMDKKLEAYVDLINNMSNKYSIDAEGLSEAIRLSAGTLKEADTSIEQAATMFATANKYYNDPDYLGNTAKIGSLRLRATTGDKDALKELSELGEDIEDVTILTGKLREELLSLTKVDIMVDNTTFKSYYNQLYEISQVIDDLDDTTSAKVLETLFGKNRAAAGASLLRGLKDSTTAYQDAINSAGSATQEYETWLQSADAAAQRFSNNLTKTYQNFINGNTVRDIANLGSSLLEFANSFGILEGTVKGFLSLKIGSFLMNGTMAFLSATKQVEQYGKALQMANNIPNGNLAQRYSALKSIAQATSSLTTAQLKQVLSNQSLTQSDRVRILMMQGMTREMANQKLVEMSLTQSTNAQTAANVAQTASTFSLKSAMIGLGNTIKGVFLSKPAGIVLMGISVAISAVTSAISNHNQKIEEMREKAKEAADKANTLGDEISDLASKYIQLSEAVKNDASAKEDLISTQAELLKKLGLEGEGIDALISKYGSLSEAIKQASIDSLQNARIDLLAGVNATEKELLKAGNKGFFGNDGFIDAKGEDAIKAFKILEKAGITGVSYGTGGGIFTLEGDNDTIDGILKNYQKIEEAIKALRESNEFTSEEFADNSLFNALYSKYSDLTEAVNNYKGAIGDLNENVAQETMLSSLQGKELPKTEEEFNSFKQELIDTATASKQFIGTEEEIADVINNYLATVPQFEGFYSVPLEKELNKVEEMLGQDRISGVTPSLDEAFSSIQKSYEALNDFKEAMDDNSLTDSILNAVAGLSDNLNTLVTGFYAGGVSADELYSALQEHYNADLNNYRNAIIAKNAYSVEFYNSVGLADADFINQFKEHYQVDLENCKTYAQAKLKIETEVLKKVGNNWQRYYDIQTNTLTAQYQELVNGARGGDAYANQILEQINKTKEMMDELNSIAYDGLDDLEATFNKISSKLDKNGKKDGSSKDSKQTIDWISRLLDVLQKKIDATKAKFENLFTVKGKQNNLDKQIKYTKDLLEATEKSADRYLKAANKVGLSSALKKKVQNGSYDISEYDSKTAEKINKYKEYWDLYKEAKQNVDELTTSVRKLKEEKLQLSADKAESKIAKSKALAELDAGNYKKQNKHLEAQKKYLKEQYDALIKIAKLNKDSVEVAKLKAELQKELNDLTMEEFNNIVNTYDNKLGLNDSKLKSFQDQISLLEARGQLVGSALYTKQMSLNNSRSKILQNELNRLVGQLAEIEKGTDDWYNAQEKLFGVKSALVQVQIENANLQKSINDLKFDRFDELINRLNDVVDEANFLKDMLSDNLFDDNGMITDDGITAMGLSAQNYDVYLAEAERYKSEMAQIEQMYASGAIGVEEYESKMREYRKGQQSAIKNANDMKKAVVDLVRDGLEKQNQALEEAVNKQKELLRAEKDLYDFQRKIADQNKTISDLRKKLNALEGDSSEEARKRKQQLRADLAKAEQEQKDTLYDRSVSDQEKALDDMLANAKEQTEAYLSDSEKVFVDSLDFVNSHTEQVSRNLEKISSDLGFDISENITNAWKNGGKAVDSYENILKGSVPNITAQIILIKSAWEEATLAAERAAEAIVKAVDAENKDLGSIGKETGSATQTATPNGTTTNSDNKSNGGSILPGALGVFDSVIKKTTLPIVEQFIDTNKQKAKKDKSKYSPLNQYIYDKENGYILSEENERKLGELLKVSLPSNTFGKAEKIKILDRLNLLGYSKGGVISDIKDAIRLNGDKVLVSANPGERMLTEKQNEYWEKWTKALPNLVNTNLQYKPYIPDFQSRNMQSPVYNIDSSITVEGVATNEIVKDMERVATKQAENVVAKINSMSYAKGVRRK